MPEKKTLQRSRQKALEGKSPSTQAGEFVREEVHHIRGGKHGARSTKQAIAIGLSKARRAGVRLPAKGRAKSTQTSEGTVSHRPSKTRSRAVSGVLKRESRSSASPRALSRQASEASEKRGAASRHRAALKAVQTKGKTRIRKAAQKAAKSRQKAA